MNRAGLLLALGLLLAPAPAQDAPTPAAEEWERPWDGFLPDQEQTIRAEDEDESGSEWFGARILDAATGRPVAGARWIRTPEWIAGGRLHHDAVMQVAVTDAEGIARLETLPWLWNDDCHWLVLADGYAPAYEYGAVPDTEVLLERGRPFRGRLLDPMGRPVAGGTVEYVGGCSHGTAALLAVAGADGSFTLGDHAAWQGQYWVEGRGIASDLLAADSPRSLGSRPGVIVGLPGLRYEGQVVDLLGRPVAACVVRSWNEQRGPSRISDADGRFVLEGVEPGGQLLLFPESDLTEDETEWDVDDAFPGIPATVVISSVGVLQEEKTALLRVNARTTTGEPAGGVGISVVRVDSGRGDTGWTADEEPVDEEDPPVGFEIFDVSPGRWRVLPPPDEPFLPFTFDPVEVTVAAGGTAEATVVVRPNPRLRIRSAVPPKASLFLAIPGAEMDEEGEDSSWSPPLPSSGPAVLRVELEGAPPYFFPVGPEKDGYRDVALSVPAPRRVLLPKGAREGGLFDGDREVAFREAEPAVLETWAEGRVTLLFTDGMGDDRELELDLPPLAGGTVEVRPGEGRILGGEVTVRLLVRGEDGKWTAAEDDVRTVEPGETAIFEEEGMQTLRCIATADGPNEVRRGVCSLRLTILDGDGDPADALVSVDGEIHAAAEGTLLLGGLEPGPHRVLVAPRDEVGGGRELRVVLTEGEPRERTVRLGRELGARLLGPVQSKGKHSRVSREVPILGVDGHLQANGEGAEEKVDGRGRDPVP